jgi:hypothetical protein
LSSKRRRSRDDSERAQRERLAKARRERERKARANLAAKARGEEEPAEAEEDAESERKAKEPSAPAKAKPKPEAPTAKSGSKDSEPDSEPAKERKREKRARRDGRRKGAGRKRGARRDRGRGGKRSRRPGILAAAGGIASAVRGWMVATVPRLGATALRLILAFFSLFFTAIGFVLNLLGAAWRFARGPLRAALLRLDALSRAASRAVTPARALTAVAAGALVLLALSQFADYRSISIGNDSYAPGIQTVAPAPVTETDATGSAHAYLMVPLAAIGLLTLAAAVTGRRRLCAVPAAIGAVAVLVALVHDRPQGLDTGDRPLAYEGVEATLVGGFYAQIAAGLLLVATSLLLLRELGPEGAGSSARRRLPALRRPRLRRRARVQGARA